MKSTKVLEANGAFKKNPKRRRPPAPENKYPIGSPPDYFTKLECAVWHEMCEDAPPGVLTASERPVITNYCRLEADMRESREDMQVWKRWKPEFEGDERPPAPRTMNPAYYGRLESILSKLGMTPLDRQRVGVSPPKDTNMFDDI